MTCGGGGLEFEHLLPVDCELLQRFVTRAMVRGWPQPWVVDCVYWHICVVDVCRVLVRLLVMCRYVASYAKGFELTYGFLDLQVLVISCVQAVWSLVNQG
jgi:hypothetical protein